MQFIVTALDGTDSSALERRMQARPAHIQLTDKLKNEGRMLFGLALLDQTGKMVGSVMVADFPDRAALDAWLKIEPYVIGKVSERIDVRACKVGPSFSSMGIAGT